MKRIKRLHNLKKSETCFIQEYRNVQSLKQESGMKEVRLLSKKSTIAVQLGLRLLNFTDVYSGLVVNKRTPEHGFGILLNKRTKGQFSATVPYMPIELGFTYICPIQYTLSQLD